MKWRKIKSIYVDINELLITYSPETTVDNAKRICISKTLKKPWKIINSVELDKLRIYNLSFIIQKRI